MEDIQHTTAEEVQTESVMETDAHATEAHPEDANFLSTLGIDGTLFIAQLINFSIVAFILWRWVFKPVVAKLDERTTTVEKGLKDAEEAQVRLENAEREEAERISNAESRVTAMIEEAKTQAEELRRERLGEAKAEVEKIVQEARETIKRERKETYDALQGEIASLVTAAVERVVKQMDADTKKKLIQEALNELEKTNV